MMHDAGSVGKVVWMGKAPWVDFIDDPRIHQRGFLLAPVGSPDIHGGRRAFRRTHHADRKDQGSVFERRDQGYRAGKI